MVAAEQLPTMDLKPPSGFKFDKTKDGYTLIEDTPLEGSPRLSLSGFLEEDESRVLGETMLERGKNTAEQLGKLAGQHHLETMLEHQDEIPVEWREFYLVGAGTVWRDGDGYRWVAYLGWNGDEWVLYFDSLRGSRWSSNDRLVRVSQVSQEELGFSES